LLSFSFCLSHHIYSEHISWAKSTQRASHSLSGSRLPSQGHFGHFTHFAFLQQLSWLDSIISPLGASSPTREKLT
jgi:hypothetical protein